MERKLFQKCSHSNKVAIQEKQAMRNIAFSKNKLFPKSTSSENAFFLNSFLTKIARVPKSTCSKELSILMKWLLRRSFAPKSSYSRVLQKGGCSEKGSSSKKVAALKKLLHRKSKCCVWSSYSGEVWSNFFKNKAVLKKSTYICEKGNLHLKKNSKLSLWLRLIRIMFSDRFFHPINNHGE